MFETSVPWSPQKYVEPESKRANADTIRSAGPPKLPDERAAGYRISGVYAARPPARARDHALLRVKGGPAARGFCYTISSYFLCQISTSSRKFGMKGRCSKKPLQCPSAGARAPL
ncbi:hypothetical protein EVAR_19518_1 [Eumeta japonica]|uniref:Uncharacterized protein n=1 Tax=Eumeta variegata TaxID=151549 RepID=A0A4C1UF66_EUMVA|nr:hypothetical protein EVAR_19518_1 [Eumeta japonica]